MTKIDVLLLTLAAVCATTAQAGVEKYTCKRALTASEPAIQTEITIVATQIQSTVGNLNIQIKKLARDGASSSWNISRTTSFETDPVTLQFGNSRNSDLALTYEPFGGQSRLYVSDPATLDKMGIARALNGVWMLSAVIDVSCTSAVE